MTTKFFYTQTKKTPQLSHTQKSIPQKKNNKPKIPLAIMRRHYYFWHFLFYCFPLTYSTCIQGIQIQIQFTILHLFYSILPPKHTFSLFFSLSHTQTPFQLLTILVFSCTIWYAPCTLLESNRCRSF